ncbi:putative myosin, light chain 2, 20 kDa [Kockovaella imperatae]|uniref:Putative myosin, light chain 2, 20 kDa n=1 Tax=Kockovaella imperatae TaxID=4999 RepID=A0A1Y1UM28_9TREE|nr:putative myosin, light chain 2, 20 kDa [Kockovaella imperatae]ORX38536.1 putative myosin, light chain 2, 20 kDa [Kockovaella imperatae]
MATKASSLGLGHASSSLKKPSHDRREPSGGAFTMFTPSQVKQFKEAFNMIDQDGDGRVTESDLKIMLSNLGQTPTSKLLNDLLNSREDTRSGVNFTQFLSMMGEHLLELDHEQEIVDAFACFDEGDKGVVQVSEMRKWLGELGDRMEDWEIERLFSGQFTDRQGRFNYTEFAKVLRVNDGEPERDDKLAV